MPDIDGRIKPGVKQLWERYYPDYRRSSFKEHVATYLRPDSDVLEIGAGSGTGMQYGFGFKGTVKSCVGVDLDPRVLDNPHLDEAYHADAADLPMPDKSFDVIFHTMVAEHLADPAAAAAEMRRVLRDDGVILFETPNRMYYPMLLASLTPTAVHSFLVNRLGSGRAEADVFPTVYGLNDSKAINEVFESVGMTVDVEYRSTPPGYLRFSRASFLLGTLYERTVERRFPKARGVIFATAKPA